MCAAFTRYLDQVHTLVRTEEGRDKPLYVSEAGWSSDPDPKTLQTRETFQADRAACRARGPRRGPVGGVGRLVLHPPFVQRRPASILRPLPHG